MAADGRLKAPLYVQFVMGVKNAMPVDQPTLRLLRRDGEADRARTPSGAGRGSGASQIMLNEWSIAAGGHTRTGLEDNLRLDRDVLAPSNAALVGGRWSSARSTGARWRRRPRRGRSSGSRPRDDLALRRGADRRRSMATPEVAALFADARRGAGDAARRGRAGAGAGRARDDPRRERPRRSSGLRARSRSTRRRWPTAWRGRGAGGRRWSRRSGASSARSMAPGCTGARRARTSSTPGWCCGCAGCSTSSTARLARLIAALGAQAERHRATVIAARTRFQIATPTTLGAKIAVWTMPLIRHRARLAELRPRLLRVSLAGASGTNAALAGAGRGGHARAGGRARARAGRGAVARGARRGGRARRLAGARHRVARQDRAGPDPARPERGRRGDGGRRRRVLDDAAQGEPGRRPRRWSRWRG